MKKGFIALVSSLVLLLAQAFSTYAGGWAVVTLDELPTQVVAGQPLQIGFVVRQHGRTPVSGLSPAISAVHTDSGKTVRATATSQGEEGHYVATLDLPSAGTWKWSVDAFGAFAQPMPALDVLANAPIATAPAQSMRAGAVPDLGDVTAALPFAIGILGVAGALAALAAWTRTRKPVLLALLVAATAVGAFSIGWAAGRPPQTQASQPADTQPEVLRGADLFLAKGCVVCHAHEAFTAERREFSGFHVGPDLTNLQRDPDYLRVWLRNPAGVKPGTEMPALGLNGPEIEALVAFLGSDNQ